MNNVAVDIGVEKPTREEVEEVLKELGTQILIINNRWKRRRKIIIRWILSFDRISLRNGIKYHKNL